MRKLGNDEPKAFPILIAFSGIAMLIFGVISFNIGDIPRSVIGFVAGSIIFVMAVYLVIVPVSDSSSRNSKPINPDT